MQRFRAKLFRFNLRSTNRGVQPAQASRLKYYLSSRNVYDSSADYLNYDAVAALEPLENGSENANLRIPASLNDGTYYILVVADDTDVVAESIESNNSIALPNRRWGFGGVGRKRTMRTHHKMSKTNLISLQPLRQSQPATMLRASAFQRVFLISNIGTSASSDSRVKYYISRDPIYDAFDKYGGYDRVGEP